MRTGINKCNEIISNKINMIPEWLWNFYIGVWGVAYLLMWLGEKADED